jgi:hypothetical protein
VTPSCCLVFVRPFRLTASVCMVAFSPAGHAADPSEQYSWFSATVYVAIGCFPLLLKGIGWLGFVLRCQRTPITVGARDPASFLAIARLNLN